MQRKKRLFISTFALRQKSYHSFVSSLFQKMRKAFFGDLNACSKTSKSAVFSLVRAVGVAPRIVGLRWLFRYHAGAGERKHSCLRYSARSTRLQTLIKKEKVKNNRTKK